MVDRRRGTLYPERLPDFQRLSAPEGARDLVAWFWVPEWDLAPGETSVQHIVGYPALNLVVTPDGIELAGATTRASAQELRGRGWAVGALLRPAAVPVLAGDPAAIVDRRRDLDAPDLRGEVAAAMRVGDRPAAIAAFSAWIGARVGEVPAAGRAANAVADLLMSDPSILHPRDAAERSAVSVRTLQRMMLRGVGLPPGAMIRRRRLQEAASRIRAEPDVDLAGLAAELGYADHAHLTNDFRTVLGLTPTGYRSARG